LARRWRVAYAETCAVFGAVFGAIDSTDAPPISAMQTEPLLHDSAGAETPPATPARTPTVARETAGRAKLRTPAKETADGVIVETMTGCLLSGRDLSVDIVELALLMLCPKANEA